MTQLTYLLPCCAGLLKVSIPILAQSLELGSDIKSGIWLSLFISLGFLSLCLLYFCFIAMQFCFSFKYKEIIGYYHLQRFKKDVARHPFVYVALLNGIFAAFELFLTVLASATFPSPSISLVLIGLTHGQFIMSLVSDLSGVFWVPQFLPWEVTATGSAFLFLGTILLLMFPMSNVFLDPWVLGRYAIALGSGILSFMNYAFTRRLSYAYVSYWAGTFTAALGQVLLFAIVSLAVDFKGNSLYAATVLFEQADKTSIFVCAVLALLLSSAAIQWYGDQGGFFSAMGPVFCGQVTLSACLEMSGKLTFNGSAAIFQKPTGSTIAALILIIIGSFLMWTGRFTKSSPSEEPHYAVQKNIVMKISPPQDQTTSLSERISLESEQSYCEDRFGTATENAVSKPSQQRLHFLTHPAARYPQFLDTTGAMLPTVPPHHRSGSSTPGGQPRRRTDTLCSTSSAAASAQLYKSHMSSNIQWDNVEHRYGRADVNWNSINGRDGFNRKECSRRPSATSPESLSVTSPVSTPGQANNTPNRERNILSNKYYDAEKNNIHAMDYDSDVLEILSFSLKPGGVK